MRVLVTGAGGQLGAGFALLAPRPGVDVVAFGSRDLDVTDRAAVARRVRDVAPDAILNATAQRPTVDETEDDPREALRVNVTAVRHLADAAIDADATLVHVSSDFVFDGAKAVPYTEDDEPNPRNVYGETKLAGELVAATAPRHLVVRVESLFGGPVRRSSVDALLAALGRGDEARAFSDRVVSPTYVPDAVEALVALLTRGTRSGTWHVVNGGHDTWEGLARRAAALLRRPAGNVRPVRVADLKLRAPRPLFCALSNEKLGRAGVPMPGWEDALARALKEAET